jgi:hypothetical protein
MCLRVKRARPVALDNAVRHAVELNEFNNAQRKQPGGQGYMRTASERKIFQKFQQKQRNQFSYRYRELQII